MDEIVNDEELPNDEVDQRKSGDNLLYLATLGDLEAVERVFRNAIRACEDLQLLGDAAYDLDAPDDPDCIHPTPEAVRMEHEEIKTKVLEKLGTLIRKSDVYPALIGVNPNTTNTAKEWAENLLNAGLGADRGEQTEKIRHPKHIITLSRGLYRQIQEMRDLPKRSREYAMKYRAGNDEIPCTEWWMLAVDLPDIHRDGKLPQKWASSEDGRKWRACLTKVLESRYGKNWEKWYFFNSIGEEDNRSKKRGAILTAILSIFAQL